MIVDREPSQNGNSALERMAEQFGDRLEHHVALSQFTSFRTGGNARYFVRCTSAEQLVEALKLASTLEIDTFLLGGGSNLLVSDSGFDGLVIKVDIRGLSQPEPKLIESGAGEDLMALVDFASECSLTGLEFAAGIWGSVGGAIYGNAGAYGGQIGNVVKDLTLIDRGGSMRTVDSDYCQFGYRDSHLKRSGEIVSTVRFALTAGNRDEIVSKVNEIVAIREAKFPPEGLSAGCFFKNIPDPTQPHGKLPAGKLLEEAGAKELSVGGAVVYRGHANVILNSGSATSQDIAELADILKKKVLEKFGIMLEEEVIRIGHFQT